MDEEITDVGDEFFVVVVEGEDAFDEDFDLVAGEVGAEFGAEEVADVVMGGELLMGEFFFSKEKFIKLYHKTLTRSSK